MLMLMFACDDVFNVKNIDADNFKMIVYSFQNRQGSLYMKGAWIALSYDESYLFDCCKKAMKPVLSNSQWIKSDLT